MKPSSLSSVSPAARRTLLERATLSLGLVLLGTVVSAQEGRQLVEGPQVEPWDDPRVLEGPVLKERLEAGEDLVQVIVNLAVPRQMRSFPAFDVPQAAARHRRDVGLLQAEVLGAVDPGEFLVKHRLENQATISGRVTRRGLEELLAQPIVESIELDAQVQKHSDQGLTLMNGDAVRALFDGTGMSVAIVDTGIEYTHPAMGGGGFPNAKVIGGYDFGDNDADPFDLDGHGTSCAGIAAGDVIFNGHYVGGVAPAARLYALKVFADGSPTTSLSDVAMAWDWCVTHKNDDPANPILVMSTSIGGGLYTSPSSCDSAWPSLATAAANVKAAGITSFVSSGNDGYCSAMAAPGCISDVISVGAVYDANIGSTGFCGISSTSCIGSPNGGCSSSTGFACFDNTTAADQVTCYSNSASFLHVLAPSHNASTPTVGGGYVSDFGGTSAACPYAAGAALVLIDAARSFGDVLTSDEVRSKLIATGDSIFDSKSSISKPRVNLGNAVDSLGTWVDFAYIGTETGAAAQPFNTLAEGVAAAPVGGMVLVKSGATTEMPTITKNVTILARGGTVTLGL